MEKKKQFPLEEDEKLKLDTAIEEAQQAGMSVTEITAAIKEAVDAANLKTEILEFVPKRMRSKKKKEVMEI